MSFVLVVYRPTLTHLISIYLLCRSVSISDRPWTIETRNGLHRYSFEELFRSFDTVSGVFYIVHIWMEIDLNRAGSKLASSWSKLTIFISKRLVLFCHSSRMILSNWIGSLPNSGVSTVRLFSPRGNFSGAMFLRREFEVIPRQRMNCLKAEIMMY